MSATKTTGTEPTLAAADSTGGEPNHSAVKFRPDIEGLRALAIIVVVLDHLGVPGFRGGFIGVDVFFVISGFLITSLLAAEQRRNVEAARAQAPGSVSIRNFYIRRAKRILPAGLAVIAFSLIAGKLLMNSIRFQTVKADALWATFFGENIHLMRQATDYFAQGTAVSPLQNYWSLAVEEQFYLVWPLMFIAAVWIYKNAHLTLAAKLRIATLKRMPKVIGNWQARVLAAVAALFAMSLVWSIHATSVNPAPAYYSPFTRAYELALGALVAMAAPMLRLDERLSELAARITGIVGFGLILASVATISPSTPFPGAWGLLPTSGAALLIIAGMNRKATTPTGLLLSSPPARFIGRISYSLYLWHWPLIVFAGLIVSKQRISAPAWDAALAVISVLVAWGSYHLIEQPFRRLDGAAVNQLLAGPKRWISKRGPFGYGSRQKAVTATHSVPKLAAMAAAALLVFGTIAALARPLPSVDGGGAELEQSVATWANWNGKDSGVSASQGSAVPAKSKWLADLNASLNHNKATDAEIKAASYGKSQWSPDTGCFGVTSESAVSRCRLAGTGTAISKPASGQPWNVALVGNSFAAQWRETLATVLPTGSKLTALTAAGCPVAIEESDTRFRDASGLSCGQHVKFWHKQVKELKPNLIVIGFEIGASDHPAEIGSLLKYARASARHVLFLGPPPATHSFSDCLRGTNDIRTCNTSKASQLEADPLYAAAAKAAGVNYLSLKRLVCVNSECPWFVNGAPVRFDGSHLSKPTMKALSGFLLDAIAKATGSKLNAPEPSPAGASKTAVPSSFSSQQAFAKWKTLIAAAANKRTATKNEVSQAEHAKSLAPSDTCWYVTDAAKVESCSSSGHGGSKAIAWPKGVAKRVVLMGHSFAGQFIDTIAQVLPRSTTLVPLILASCDLSTPTSDHARLPNGRDCGAHNRFAFEQAAKAKPGLVIFSAQLRNQADAQSSKVRDMARRIKGLGAQTLMIVNAPNTVAVSDCLDGADSSKCGRPSSPSSSVGKAISAGHIFTSSQGFQELSISKLTCTITVCPPFIDGVLTRWDQERLTTKMMQRLEPFIARSINLALYRKS